MIALVRIEADRVLADSRDVATEFGKQHQHVLRSIREMLGDCPELLLNFEEQSYQVQGGRTRRAACRFDMDRKGFMMLVMSFNGAKALAIKSRWLDAFDAMERALLAREEVANDDAMEGPAVPPLADAARICAIAESYRRIYGVTAARMIMTRYGMPTPSDDMVADGDAVATLPSNSNAVEWLRACCVADPESRESATEMYRAYLEWCAESQRVPETQAGFGRGISAAGVSKMKSAGGRVLRRGVRLLK